MMSSKTIAHDSLLMMGAVNHITTMRHVAKATVEEHNDNPLRDENDIKVYDEVKVDTSTIVDFLDSQYLNMHYVIHEALKKSNTLKPKYAAMQRVCNLYRFMDSLRLMATKLGVEVDEEYAQRISKFAKQYNKM